MLVKNWMSTNVITVDVKDSMQKALSLMKENKIRMLPVLKKGKLVGIVSQTDIKTASASNATLLDVHELLYLISKIKVEEIMTKNPITVHPECTVEETAELLMEHKISGVPVVDEKQKVVGIITRSDLFRVLITLSAFGKKGVQLAFQVEDRPGSIKELTDVIRNYNGRIASILGTYERAPAGYRNVYIRVYDIDREKLGSLEKELREKAKMLYVVDHGGEDRKECTARS